MKKRIDCANVSAAATDQKGDGLAKNAIPVISPIRPKIAE